VTDASFPRQRHNRATLGVVEVKKTTPRRHSCRQASSDRQSNRL